MSTGTKRIRAARWRLAALLAGLATVAGLCASPAAATEGVWINEGGAARSPEAMSVTWHNGDRFEFLRGDDDQIYWTYRNQRDSWRLLPGGGRTLHRPSAVSMTDSSTGADYLAVFHIGVDREVYYSLLGGAAGNIWSPWRHVAGSAGATGSITARAVFNVGTLSAVRGDRVIWQRMELANGALRFEPGWVTEATPRIRAAGTESNLISSHILTDHVEMQVAVGQDRHVWYTRFNADSPSAAANASYQELPGGGECESVAIGGQGDNVAIGCVSPNDHSLWVNRSTNRGSNWSGWAPTTGGTTTTYAGPEITADPGGEVFANISWGGAEGNGIKQRMILMKRVI